MPNQHRHTPISYRPSADLRARLEAFSASTGRPVRGVISDALGAFLDDVGAFLDQVDELPGARAPDPAPVLADSGHGKRSSVVGDLAAAVDSVSVCLCSHSRRNHRNERGRCQIGGCMCSRYRRDRG